MPATQPPNQKRVLLMHSLFEEPPTHTTPLAVGISAQLQTHRERTEALLEDLGFSREMDDVMILDACKVFFTDEPLEVNLGSSDTHLLRVLLQATPLDDLSTFSHNPKGLTASLRHGLLQWE